MQLNSIGFHPNTAGFFNKRNWSINDRREIFFKKLKLFDFNKVVSHFFDDKADVGLVGFNGSANYGSILNTYSVYNNLEKLGYMTLLISYIPYYLNIKHFYNKKFHKRYFSFTKPYKHKYEMYELNNNINIFIAGSDQIFRFNAENWDHRGRKYFNIFYLSFVSHNKQLISFASSFGHNTYGGDYYNRIYNAYCLKRFDSISVREKDAIGLMKEKFNIENVEQVIEPVFTLDYEEWDKIIADSSLNHKGKLAYYFLDPTEEKEEAIKYISEKLNIEPIDAVGNFFREVEDFLYIIKNADFVITDSFHGTCFSVVFKKQFISFLNKGRGESRYALFEELKQKDRIINNLDELKNKKDLFDKIDYTETFEIIKKEKERAIFWLKNALENKRDKKITPQLSMIEYLIYENDSLDLKLKNANNEIINLQNSLRNEINERQNWVRLFGVYNTKEYLIFYFFGIKISFRMNEKRVNNLAWWIPIRKWRDNFRNKMNLNL